MSCHMQMYRTTGIGTECQEEINILKVSVHPTYMLHFNDNSFERIVGSTAGNRC